MARRGAVALALAFAALLGIAAGARAETLQRLTVTQLSLAADTATPHIEVPFHLIVTAHVRERIARLENVDLPILAEVEILGDQSATVRDASGTTYRETITVVAHHSGTIAIAPVTLDAIDARTGKPMRYSSAPLTLQVAGPGFASQAGSIAVGIARTLVALFALLLSLGALGAVVMLLARRAPARPLPLPPPPPEPPAPPPPPRSRADDLRDALATLRAEPGRGAALRVRSFVRRMVGASDAETLDDVLRTIHDDEPMRALLRALERASFTHDADLDAAVRDALAQLERMTA